MQLEPSCSMRTDRRTDLKNPSFFRVGWGGTRLILRARSSSLIHRFYPSSFTSIEPLSIADTQETKSDLGRLFVEISGSNTIRHIHLLRLLCTSDRHVAGTSVWQHTTLMRDEHPCPGGIRMHDPNKREAEVLRVSNSGWNFVVPCVLWGSGSWLQSYISVRDEY